MWWTAMPTKCTDILRYVWVDPSIRVENKVVHYWTALVLLLQLKAPRWGSPYRRRTERRAEDFRSRAAGTPAVLAAYRAFNRGDGNGPNASPRKLLARAEYPILRFRDR